MLLIPINDDAVVIVAISSIITIEDLVNMRLYLWYSIKDYTG
jgi:hypothetical protein